VSERQFLYLIWKELLVSFSEFRLSSRLTIISGPRAKQEESSFL
jgi:hypothetical protein